jgi:hypothetical protein
MKKKKRDITWFEQKVGELGEAIKRLPDERQLELFDQMEKDRPGERGKENTRKG